MQPIFSSPVTTASTQASSSSSPSSQPSTLSSSTTPSTTTTTSAATIANTISSTSTHPVITSTLGPISSTISQFFSSSSTHQPSSSFSSSSSSSSISSSSTSSDGFSSTPSSSPASSTTYSSTTSTTTSNPQLQSTTTIHSQADSPIRHNQSPVTIYESPPPVFRPDRLATIDLIIVVIYLCLLLSTSISTMIRTRKSNKRKAALAGHKGQQTNNFLASGRKMNWFTVGASIFASNLGSEHFIGLSGSAAANGISVAAFEMNALIILQLATWIFLPVLIVSKISTLPEYMSKRFGGKRIRTYLAILSILLYIFTKISVNLFSGGIFLQQAIGWNLYSSAMFILALTCIMTLTGGLKGAMVIDNMQAIVMTIGASIVSMKALVAIGGWDGLKHRYANAVPTKVPANLTHCAQPNPRAFQMLRPWDDRDMPWIGFLIGQTPASIWYWAADQMMVQRFLSARSLAHCQGSSVFAGYLKILPLLFMVIPGMISRCLYTDEVGCIDPIECQRYCQSSVSCSNTAYPRLVLELMPMGARGMMVAAMVAALMGDLCNVFNSASALFSCDIWPLFRKHATQKEQETVGRLFVMFLVFASIMWIPVIQEMQGGQLFIYIQAVAAMFAPPIAGVYICAVLWKRTNETGAFWALMLGFFLGVLRMTMSFMYKEPSCGQHIDERPWILKHVHYMYYAAFLFWATIGCCTLISYYTKPPAPFRLIRTTYWTRFDTSLRKDDKNVFEMKYSGATTKTTGSGGGLKRRQSSSKSNGRQRNDSIEAGSQVSMLRNQAPIGTTTTTTSSEADSSSTNEAFMMSQQKLFTIDEQQREQQKKTADLSSVVVDINKAAAAATNQQQQQQQIPTPNQASTKRQPLQHQASLSASASAAVGAASEAGKFLANKLANEVNLKGAKEMMMAAANHLSGGVQNSRIKFKNLEGEEDDDDEDVDVDDFEDDDEEEFDDDERRDESSMIEEEDDDDDDDEVTNANVKRKRQLKKRGQSVLSAALSSYKQKQRSGYRQAADDDFDDDEDEDDDDDDDDEKMNLNRSASFKNRVKSTTSDLSSSADERQSNLALIETAGHPGDGSGGCDGSLGNSISGGRTAAGNRMKKTTVGQDNNRRQSSRNRQAKWPPRNNSMLSSSSSTAGAAAKKRQINPKKIKQQNDDEEEDFGPGASRNYKCLDNSVSLLIKTRFEETILRVALIAVILVAIGLFILFSLPPTQPPKAVVDMLMLEEREKSSSAALINPLVSSAALEAASNNVAIVANQP